MAKKRYRLLDAADPDWAASLQLGDQTEFDADWDAEKEQAVVAAGWVEAVTTPTKKGK